VPPFSTLETINNKTYLFIDLFTYLLDFFLEFKWQANLVISFLLILILLISKLLHQLPILATTVNVPSLTSN